MTDEQKLTLGRLRASIVQFEELSTHRPTEIWVREDAWPELKAEIEKATVKREAPAVPLFVPELFGIPIVVKRFLSHRWMLVER